MKKVVMATFWIAAGLALPHIACAQNLGSEIHGLHAVLNRLYADMMPLCSQLIDVSRGIAGFAATWYIASRIWRHIASAEPIDFYPLFRPFVIGFAIIMFPSVLDLMNGVLSPTVIATEAMVSGSDKAIAVLLQRKEEAIKNTTAWKMYVGETGIGDRDKWYKYSHPGEGSGGEGMVESVGNDIKFAMSKASYNFRNSVKEWMSEVLRILYETAALCINTIRTFNLVVLAILGPFIFGISVFDGFHHTLTAWIARYINIFLWLPVANIFGSIIGKIQEEMVSMDIAQVQSSGDTIFNSTDTAYLIFLIIGIIGYFTVPSVANYIVHAGGGNALLYRTSNVFSSTSGAAASTVSGSAGMAASAVGYGADKIKDGVSSLGIKAVYSSDRSASRSHDEYMRDKLSGKSE